MILRWFAFNRQAVVVTHFIILQTHLDELISDFERCVFKAEVARRIGENEPKINVEKDAVGCDHHVLRVPIARALPSSSMHAQSIETF